MVDVSIVIINYKTPEMVIDCVKSIQEKTKDITYEIIVVDNASNDNSISCISSALAGQIKLISSSVNLGFGKGNNLGVEQAEGKFLFLLNSDTLLMNNAVKILFDYLEENTNVGIVGGNLFDISGKPSGSYCESFDTIENLKNSSSYLAIIKQILKRRKNDKIQDLDKRIYEKQKEHFNFSGLPMKVGYIYGADMMMSRKLFLEVGGFDKDFFMYGEEEDLTRRVHDKNYEVYSVPEAKIIHFDGASIKKADSFNPNSYKMRQNGAMMYYLKRYGEQGPESFYKYKKLTLQRNLMVARLFHRPLLMESSTRQLRYLEESYNEFTGGK